VEEAIEVRGEVRWVRPYSDRTDNAPGMGVQFSNLDERSAQLIKRFLKTRDPIFYDE
jgi:Tfp pilus assembly protein PilZ